MSRYLYKKIQNISPESLNFQHSGLKLTTLGSDHLTRSLNPKAEGEIVIVRLGGETHDEKGLLDLLYGLFSGNQKKVLSYIPDADNQICQKGGLIC